MEEKRVYVGGLYNEATEQDVKQLFSKFGDVKNVEIKKRTANDAVNFVFGYVNLEIRSEDLTKCFRRLSGTFWKGHRLKLELARESFLSRLQREREQSGAKLLHPPQPPRPRSQQQQILDSVLSKQRRQLPNGTAPNKSNTVIDFTQQADDADAVSSDIKKRKKDIEKSSPVDHRPELSGGSASKFSTKHVEYPVETPPDGDATPMRGRLRMFGGIGEEPGSDAKATDASVKRKSKDGESSEKKKEKRKRHVKSEEDTSNDEKSPERGREPEANELPDPERGGGDFLSRLEAFSSVWGDNEEESHGTVVPPRLGRSEVSASATSERRSKKARRRDEDRLTEEDGGGTRIKVNLDECPNDHANDVTDVTEEPVTPLSSFSASASTVSSRSQKNEAGHLSGLESNTVPPSVRSDKSPVTSQCAGRKAMTSARDDNQRRIESLKQKQETFKNQKRALQLALSSKGDTPRPNKKIVFDDLDTDAAGAPPTCDVTSHAVTPLASKKKGVSLFEDGEEEEEGEEDFRIRPQYEGKKGQKLRTLQSTYGADARFTLDERFAEVDGEPAEDGEEEPAETEDGVKEEHVAQMDILQSVLGHSVASVSKSVQKHPASTSGPVRYDPSLEAHSQYQLEGNSRRPPEKWEESPAATTASSAEAPKVSTERYHTVETSLGDLFTGKTGESGGFSLLEMMGRTTDDAGSSITEGEYRSTKIKPKVKSNPVEGSGNPFQYDSSSSEDEPEDGSTGAALGLAPGGWSQTRKFFLQAGDGRLTEGSEFARSARSSVELQQLAMEQRAELLELFRTQKHSRQREMQKSRGRGRRGGRR